MFATAHVHKLQLIQPVRVPSGASSFQVDCLREYERWMWYTEMKQIDRFKTLTKTIHKEDLNNGKQ